MQRLQHLPPIVPAVRAPNCIYIHALSRVLECRRFESHLRQLIFSRKSECLGCAVLLCLVCLFDLACASFFLPSHLSFKNMHQASLTLVVTPYHR